MVLIDLPEDLGSGGYTVAWRVISADGHPLAGAFSFGIGGAAVPQVASIADAVPLSTSIVLAGSQWLGYVGVAGLIGGALFLLFCRPTQRLARLRRIILGGGGLAVVATVAELLVTGPYYAGLPATAMTDLGLLADAVTTRDGVWVAARGLFLLATTLIAYAILQYPVQAETDEATQTDDAEPVRTRPPPWMVACGGVLAVVVAIAFGASGHAATDDNVALAVGTNAAHLLAMSAWLGGLVSLLAVSLPPGDASPDPRLLRRFSTTAVVSVAALLFTGVVQAWRELESFGELTSTTFGALVTAKSGMFAALLVLGALSFLAVRKSSAPRGPLRRTVPVEAFGVAVVLGLTAVLVTTSPGDTAADGPPPISERSETLDLPDGSQVTIELGPGVVGSNEVTVEVTGDDVERVGEVRADMTLESRALGPIDAQLERTGPRTFTGQITLPFEGEWALQASVSTPAGQAYVVEVPIVVGPSRPGVTDGPNHGEMDGHEDPAEHGDIDGHG